MAVAAGPELQPTLTASRSPAWLTAVGAFAAIAVAWWCGHHALALLGVWHGRSGGALRVIYAAGFAVFAAQMVLSYLERPKRAGRGQRADLDRLNVVALVPAFNEDPAILKACVGSMLGQTRRPQTICVTDDGSPIDYSDVRAWAETAARAAGVDLLWIRQDNEGKRHAQAAGVLATPQADVYWTTDSDSVSDPRALDELLQPLADPRVQSVAGVVLGLNNDRSVLARITDLWFVTAQLVDRSALSTLGSVWVNSGPVAVYRAPVLRDNLAGYLSERFFAREVAFSDDSMLTLYAMKRGRTVQQPTAFAFAWMPETLDHHLRQYVRWMRGSFIRSWWRARYLPLSSPAYWIHVYRWTQAVLAAVVFAAVVLVWPVAHADLRTLPWLAGVTVGLAYCQTLRYLTVARSDRSTWWRLCTWLLAPAAAVWAAVVLRSVRWYAVATCWRTGWGTRNKVQLRLSPDTPHTN